MSEEKDQRRLNLVLVGLLGLIVVFTAYHEGYFPIVSGAFWAVLVGGIGMAVWLALTVSTRRLLSLILAVFMIEYVKEAIGIRSRFWTYHGTDGLFNFGVWSWVLGGLSAYTLATKVLMKHLTRPLRVLPRWLNPFLLLAVAALVPLTLGKYWDGVGVLFTVFYLALLVTDMLVSVRMGAAALVAIVVASWVIGNPSEYLGAIASGVWTYTHDAVYPPVFLVFGCWPVEILAQCSLSSFLAGEPFDGSEAPE